MTRGRRVGRVARTPSALATRFVGIARTSASVAAVTLVASFATGAARAGATRDLEQAGTYLDACAFHYGQLESDVRQAARDFCSNLGGVRDLEAFERHEELVRENEFSQKFRCTVRSRATCYAAE